MGLDREHKDYVQQQVAVNVLRLVTERMKMMQIIWCHSVSRHVSKVLTHFTLTNQSPLITHNCYLKASSSPLVFLLNVYIICSCFIVYGLDCITFSFFAFSATHFVLKGDI